LYCFDSVTNQERVIIMKLKLAIAALLATASLPASAAVLVLRSGWQSDNLDVAGQPTSNSPWTFTVTQSALFSLTDAFIVGDIWTVTGDIAGISSFYAGASDMRADGSFFGNAWTNGTYSHLEIPVGPGTYTFTITGDGAGGLPAGLGIRLDAAVPEPSTWLMLVAGFGLMGAAMRRRGVAVSFA